MAETQPSYHLACACKAVELDIRGVPLFQSRCWCSSCAAYHQRTGVPTVMWKSDSVAVTKGAEQLGRFSVRDPAMARFFCTVCGSRVYQEVEGFGIRGLLPTSIDGFEYQPSLHVFCGDAAAEALQQYKGDGLPKYKGLPSHMGGSGEQVDV